MQQSPRLILPEQILRVHTDSVSAVSTAADEDVACAYDQSWGSLSAQERKAAEVLGMTSEDFQEDFQEDSPFAESKLSLSPATLPLADQATSGGTHNGPAKQQLDGEMPPGDRPSEPQEVAGQALLAPANQLQPNDGTISVKPELQPNGSLGATSADGTHNGSTGAEHSSLTEQAIPEGVPRPTTEIRLQCTRWEDSSKLGMGGSRHVRYMVEVTAPGRDPYELPKRWQEISELSKNLYKYDYLPHNVRWEANGEKPLPSKMTRAGFDKARLDRRVTEINEFLEHLSTWMNRLLNRTSGPINLLGRDGQRGRTNLISAFFEKSS